MAGLRPRDHTVAINGKDVSNVWYEDIVQLLRKMGQIVKLLITRALDMDEKVETMRITIVRVKGEPLRADLHYHRNVRVPLTRVLPGKVANQHGLVAGDRATHINGVHIRTRCTTYWS